MDDVVLLVISRADSYGRRCFLLSPGLIRPDDMVLLVISRADSYGRRGVSCHLQG